MIKLQTFYETEEEAFEEVRRGRAWGALVFAANYSESLVERVEAGQFAEESTIDAAAVSVRLDMSSELRTNLIYFFY